MRDAADRRVVMRNFVEDQQMSLALSLGIFFLQLFLSSRCRFLILTVGFIERVIYQNGSRCKGILGVRSD